MTLMEVRPSNTSCNGIDNWIKNGVLSLLGISFKHHQSRISSQETKHKKKISTNHEELMMCVSTLNWFLEHYFSIFGIVWQHSFKNNCSLHSCARTQYIHARAINILMRAYSINSCARTQYIHTREPHLRALSSFFMRAPMVCFCGRLDRWPLQKRAPLHLDKS